MNAWNPAELDTIAAADELWILRPCSRTGPQGLTRRSGWSESVATCTCVPTAARQQVVPQCHTKPPGPYPGWRG